MARLVPAIHASVAKTSSQAFVIPERRAAAHPESMTASLGIWIPDSSPGSDPE